MSKDIRSFFTVLSKKNEHKQTAQPVTPAIKKKSKRLIDSDDEDVIESTPEPLKEKPKKKHIPAKNVISDSDEEQSLPKKKKCSPEKKKLIAVNIEDIFPKRPIKQSKVPDLPEPATKEEKPKKSKKNKNNFTEMGIHDDDFEKTLMDLDENILIKQADAYNGSNNTQEDNSKKDKSPSPKKNSIKSPDKHSSPKNMEPSPRPNGSSTKKKEDSAPKKRQRKQSQDEKISPKKPKLDYSDSGVDPDREKYERRRQSAAFYQQYLKRGGPKHHGEKEIPRGKPNCLSGLTFLRTGVLDSLESEEFNKLITDHGGRVVQSVSKKVNYLVVGDEPGPAKMEKATSLNIPIINEDELLDLVLIKSGMEPKYCKDKKPHFDVEKNVPVKEEPTKKEPVLKEKVKTIKTKKEESKSEDLKPLNEKIEVANINGSNVCDLPLTEKYKPKELKQIIGQQGEQSNMNKLKRWLINWHQNQDLKNKNLIKKPFETTKGDGAYYKAALLSGSPGVGKTTTAILVAKELNLDIVEFNASDTRNKKSLREEVSQLLNSQTLANFAYGGEISKKRVLIMDEVDGMAGNEDRGGIQELINLIKTTQVPIICMCNDRNHPKIRYLVTYCYDLRFTKPKMEQIRGAMMSICFKESIKIDPQTLTEIILGTGCDIRQTLNHISMWAASTNSISFDYAKKEAQRAKKDTIMGEWEVCRAVFTESDRKSMSIEDKARLFFYDYNLGPLFVQENYLKVKPSGADVKETLRKVSRAAESIAMGDQISKAIRENNQWGLLETQAFFSSVIPGEEMCGHFNKSIDFPSWLGKNSKRKKIKRLLGEIHSHIRKSFSSDQLSFILDFLIPLTDTIVLPLKKKGKDGIKETVDIMRYYGLLREDLDSLLELYSLRSEDKKNPMQEVDSTIKSAFTRAYNKLVPCLLNVPRSKKKESSSDMLIDEEEEVLMNESEEEEEKDDTVDQDAFIKVKKVSAKPAQKPKASTSKKVVKEKQPAKGKGRGKK